LPDDTSRELQAVANRNEKVFAYLPYIQEMMAKLLPVNHQDRNEFVVFASDQWVGIDIQNMKLEQKLAAQSFERGEHVIAEMAIAAAI
jgi:hypothetical protein